MKNNKVHHNVPKVPKSKSYFEKGQREGSGGEEEWGMVDEQEGDEEADNSIEVADAVEAGWALTTSGLLTRSMGGTATVPNSFSVFKQSGGGGGSKK